jgi:hypothetical protein
MLGVWEIVSGRSGMCIQLWQDGRHTSSKASGVFAGEGSRGRGGNIGRDGEGLEEDAVAQVDTDLTDSVLVLVGRVKSCVPVAVTPSPVLPFRRAASRSLSCLLCLCSQGSIVFACDEVMLLRESLRMGPVGREMGSWTSLSAKLWGRLRADGGETHCRRR